jgi:hypothetical protein
MSLLGTRQVTVVKETLCMDCTGNPDDANHTAEDGSPLLCRSCDGSGVEYVQHIWPIGAGPQNYHTVEVVVPAPQDYEL